MSLTLAYHGRYTAAQLCEMPREFVRDADIGHHADNAKYKATTLSAWWLPSYAIKAVYDANFAAPTNWQTCKNLMERFTHSARVLFAVTAAEMALTNWERWIAEQKEIPQYNGKPIDIHAPQKAILAAWNWLAVIECGDSAADSAVRSAYSAAYSADSAARSAYSADSAARSAYSAARSAYSAADSAYSAAYSADSADSAARSAYSNRVVKLTYAAWWARCRCRLAVANVQSVELGQ